MFQHVRNIVFVAILAALFALLSPSRSNAESEIAPQVADSAYDLITAVNSLRASNGLPPYNINTVLMYTAQNQAEFMAASGPHSTLDLKRSPIIPLPVNWENAKLCKLRMS